MKEKTFLHIVSYPSFNFKIIDALKISSTFKVSKISYNFKPKNVNKLETH